MHFLLQNVIALYSINHKLNYKFFNHRTIEMVHCVHIASVWCVYEYYIYTSLIHPYRTLYTESAQSMATALRHMLFVTWKCAAIVWTIHAQATLRARQVIMRFVCSLNWNLFMCSEQTLTVIGWISIDKDSDRKRYHRHEYKWHTCKNGIRHGNSSAQISMELSLFDSLSFDFVLLLGLR